MEHRSEGWEGRLGDPQFEEVSDTADGRLQEFPQGQWVCRGGARRGGQSLGQAPVAGPEEARDRVLRMPHAPVEAQSTTEGCKTTPRAFGRVCYGSWHEVPL